MDKMQSFDPKKDGDFTLMTRLAYHALHKSAGLLDEINTDKQYKNGIIRIKLFIRY